jgi:4'-phosphopantetheinyl transferase
VDIEPASRQSVLPELADRVCTPAELATIASMPVPQRGLALLALWVRKEAFLKAAGIGLAREMSDFAAPEAAWLMLPAGVDRVRIGMLDAGPDCIGAVATASTQPVDMAWVRP